MTTGKRPAKKRSAPSAGAAPGKKAKAKRPGRKSLSDAVEPGKRAPLVAMRWPPHELEEIDALAGRYGVGRSEMIRRLVEAGRKALEKR